jgi:hypothetical protein
MHLVIALPGLLALPLERGPDAPGLARLLAAATPAGRAPDGADAALAACYGIERVPGGDVPLAAIRLAALGGDPGTSFWLAAHPVNLEAGREDVRLCRAVRDLDADEARALVGALDAHFAADGLSFVAPRPGAWFVRAAAACTVRTRPLAVAEGRMLRELLCTGPDAPAWRRRQNEAGMLLHAHPVNVERERAGKAPVNGVWLADGGALPARADDAPRIATFAGSGVAVALAVHAGSAAKPLPAGLDAALAAAAPARTIVVALEAPIDVAAIERNWAAPAWTALTRGRLEAVTVLADGGDEAIVWQARRPKLARRLALALWRPNLALLAARVREHP